MFSARTRLPLFKQREQIFNLVNSKEFQQKLNELERMPLTNHFKEQLKQVFIDEFTYVGEDVDIAFVF